MSFFEDAGVVPRNPLNDFKVGWKARLFGFKLIERGDSHAVISLPWWCNEKMQAAAAARSDEQIKLTNVGRNVTLTRAGRYIRIDVLNSPKGVKMI